MNNIITTSSFKPPYNALKFASNQKFRQFFRGKHAIMVHLLNTYVSWREVEYFQKENKTASLVSFHKVRGKFKHDDNNLNEAFFNLYSYEDFVYISLEELGGFEILPSATIIKIDERQLLYGQMLKRALEKNIRPLERILFDSKQNWSDSKPLNLAKKIRTKSRSVWNLQADG